MNSKLLSAAVALATFACLGLAAARPSSPAPSFNGPTRPVILREDIPEPEPVVSLSEVTITASPVKKHARRAKAWTCGAFEHLENDATQMVRRCEWR